MPVVMFMDVRALQHFARDADRLAFDLAGSNRMRQPLLKIGREVLSPSIEKNFAVGGRPKKWEQVGTSKYRDQKGDRLGESSPLWVTGKLKRSAKAFARFKVKNNELTYGYFPATLWYAGVHDDAASAKRAEIPQRPFALIQAQDIDDARDIFWDWFEDKINLHIKRFYF